jgi:hypothetical protein
MCQVSLSVVVFSFFLLAGVARAQVTVLEPDDYADRAVLNTIIPQVKLATLGRENQVYELFDVTANNDGFGYAPTGTHVFGHANVGFWNDDRRLRMSFTSPTGFISLDFAGGMAFQAEIGQLEIYNSEWQLLDTYITLPRGPGEKETMSLTRADYDIAYAIAYVPEGKGSFGRLDNLQFKVVPEPGTTIVASLGLAVLLLRRSRRA